MKEIRFFYVPEASEQNELPLEEATHAIRVLRMQQGDEIVIMDGKGFFHKSRISLVTNKRCFYEILSSEQQQCTSRNRIHLAIAPTKMIDRMEWLAEKITEIGVDEITFLSCDFSERKKIRKDRIEKIIISAMKQSRKAWLPIVNEITDYNDFITQESNAYKYICHCYNEIDKTHLKSELFNANDSNKDIIILIGPEGDFSFNEVKRAIDNGYSSVTLGDSRLRTETAALYAISMIHVVK